MDPDHPRVSVATPAGPSDTGRRFARFPYRMLLAVAVLGVVAACSSDDTYLPPLLADPMASYEADGIELLRSAEQGENKDPFWGKPIHAEVRRVYRILDQDNAIQVLEQAAAQAASVGWDVGQSSTTSTLYIGSKDMDTGQGRISIGLHAEDPLQDPKGPRELSIRLDFGPVAIDES